MADGSHQFKNQLLMRLSEADADLLAPHFEAVSLEIRQTLESPDQQIDNVYFPDSGLLSVVPKGDRDHPVEVGIIGRDGMSGIAVVMGDDRSPNSVFVQVAGAAQRISSERMRRSMERSATLRLSLLKFVNSFMIQIAYTATANARGRVEERLARWLLMAHDRADGDELP
jgi:CRP-like cAMP-binding protein